MKKVKIIFIVFMIIVLVVVSINTIVVKQGSKYIVSIEDCPKVDAIIVLGARVYEDGNPSSMLEDRLIKGIELYSANISSKILLSGDHGTKGYDEVNGMKDYVLKQEIPNENVFLDHAGFSTYDSMYRAKNIFKIESAIIVTQEYHLKRALYIANQLGIKAWGVSADLKPYNKAQMNLYKSREFLARVKDWFKVNIFKSESELLGEEIPIWEDGTQTHDKG